LGGIFRRPIAAQSSKQERSGFRIFKIIHNSSLVFSPSLSMPGDTMPGEGLTKNAVLPTLI
jgi:hypothetical protein